MPASCAAEIPPLPAYPEINESRPARIPCCERLLDDGPSFSTELPVRRYKDSEMRARKEARDGRLVPPQCTHVLPLLQRVFHDLAHVKRRDARAASATVEQMWHAGSDGPKLHVQIVDGVGYVARMKRGFGSSEGERDHAGDYRIGPILVAIRDTLRKFGKQVPNVQFVVDLDDKTFESKLPLLAFAAMHPRASLPSSVLLVPDWTHMPQHKMREWDGWTYDHSTDKWAGNLSSVLARGERDLRSVSAWRKRDPRALWRGFTPVRGVGLDGLPLVDMRWSHRMPYVELRERHSKEFDIADPLAASGARFLNREEQCDYRTRLFLNGDCCHVSHGGLKWALACASLAVWIQPIWVLHWYHLLRDGEHFVIARTPDNLRDRLHFFRKRPSCAFTVATSGHGLVKRYLCEGANLCYWATLLRGLATKLPYGGELHPSAKRIEATLWQELRQFADAPST